MAAGEYKLSFRGAGFVQLWYPGAASDADATAVEVKTGEQKQGLDIALGGVPASITGTVVGDDVSARDAVPETVPPPAGRFDHDEHHRHDRATCADHVDRARRRNGLERTCRTGNRRGRAQPDDGGAAIVQKVPIGSDGTFSLDNVPSPNVYELVVVKTGYATTTQRLDVAGGEQRTGVQITLRKGDGLISGIVTDAAGPLANVTLTATSGATSVTTVSLTDGQQGQVHAARVADARQLHGHRDGRRSRDPDAVADPRVRAEADGRRRSRWARRRARCRAW